MTRLAIVWIASLVLGFPSALGQAPKGEPNAIPVDPRIGTWDGKTQTAELEGPYEDPLQQAIPFGRRSYYLSPWRAYMDTWPASRFLQCLGINFNIHKPEQAEPVAQVLAEAGIRSARVEVGWGHLSYDDPNTMPEANARRLTATLQALRKHGIRPLILLNANSGGPCPMKVITVKLLKDAPAGAKEIFIDKMEGIVPHRTGPRGQAYQCAFPLVVGVDKDTGRCDLSAPLVKPLPSGRLDLFTLKFQPFGGAAFADGTPNGAAGETLNGWMAYVTCVCRTVKGALGTEKASDAGFDIEVWNEYTFGSQFLNDRNYYDPNARKYKEPISYTRGGLTRTGCEIILPMTVDYVNDPNHGLPGVDVLSGFANQRPWESGTEMWPGQAGFSRHYYTGINPGSWEGTRGLLSPQTETLRHQVVLNALGKDDGLAGSWEKDTVIPLTCFVPVHAVNMPEFWHFAYKTEFMTRDVQPFPGPWEKHHRYSHPENSRPAQVRMTEFNLDRGPWANHLIRQTGCEKSDPRLIELMHHVAAKATLRTFVFHSHKGVHTINLFAAREGDTSLGVIPEAFYKALVEANCRLTEEVRRHIGPQLAVLRRVTELMKKGAAIRTARRLSVAKLVEHQPRLVFKGDGTPGRPDRFHRDDFACLPFQLDANTFAVGYYVVTRDIIHEWNKDAGVLDGRRYDMPDQTFDLTLANVAGKGAKLSAWDPMTDKAVAVESLGGDDKTLTVRLSAADYPRFLIVGEASKVGLAPADDTGARPSLQSSSSTSTAPTTRPGTAPAYEPTSSYARQEMQGWTVYVSRELSGEHKDTGEKVLELLRVKLYDVNRVIPPAALEKLHKVPIWVEYKDANVTCACYHPSREWLTAHGFNPDKAGAVELGNAATFLSWTREQPAMVLHELAHAYHHQVLTHKQPDILAAYKRATESKIYESVLHYDGQTCRAYAIKNIEEYFAELTEAWFGTNDFFPFVRAEVMKHDPEMAKVLRKVWGQ